MEPTLLPGEGWIPEVLVPTAAGTQVRWIELPARNEPAPFLMGSFREYRRRHPDCPSPLSSLQDLRITRQLIRGNDPEAIIFHVSRCGSTLLTNFLRCSELSLVLSEPELINNILLQHLERLPLPDGNDPVLQGFIRGALWASGQHHNANSPYIVKLTSWNTLFAPLFRRIWPDALFVFLYRDPVEVLVSLRNSPTRWARWIAEQPRRAQAVLGLDEIPARRLEEAYAKVIAMFLDTMYNVSGPSLVVSYGDITVQFAQDLLANLGVPPSRTEVEMIESISRNHSKTGKLFVPDSDAKRRAAGMQLTRIADKECSAQFARLAQRAI